MDDNVDIRIFFPDLFYVVSREPGMNVAVPIPENDLRMTDWFDTVTAVFQIRIPDNYFFKKKIPNILELLTY